MGKGAFFKKEGRKKNAKPKTNARERSEDSGGETLNHPRPCYFSWGGEGKHFTIPRSERGRIPLGREEEKRKSEEGTCSAKYGENQPVLIRKKKNVGFFTEEEEGFSKTYHEIKKKGRKNP